MDGWMDGRTDRRTDERMDGRTDRKTDRQTEIKTDRQTDRKRRWTTGYRSCNIRCVVFLIWFWLAHAREFVVDFITE